jgi:ethanolamine ammonia-lyase small subunit
MSGDGTPTHADPWAALRRLTPARVALGRTGGSLPTAEVLRFGHAHALARDAVHAGLDLARLEADLVPLGVPLIVTASAAGDRATYLRRPDLGRRLAPEERARLAATPGPGIDLTIVVADGLSATAVQSHAAPLLHLLLPAVQARGWAVAPLVLATQARVAIGDDIGEALDARMVLVLIGERPGLSAPDSLGAYLTLAPRVGRRDHERNCVSNIRPAGLSPGRAAHAILWLAAEAFRRGGTGVALKDESGDIELVPPPSGAPALP